MKKTILALTLLTVSTAHFAQTHDGGYPITPVPFTQVKLVPETFWGQRLQASREVTIPLAFSKCESEGRYVNFEHAAHPSPEWKVGGFPFDDTDVYKTIEGASYLLQTFPDKKLEAYMDSIIRIVGQAQEPDGYLYTARTQNPEHPHAWSQGKRWEQVEAGSHEFYNLGHMLEGAVAHYQATGKRSFLDIAIRYADCVCREIGNGPGQQVRVPGHQIAEMGLAKLYVLTGDKKYLDQAKFFLDMRGKTQRKDAYSQSHRPVIEQDEAVGHAVRAEYMYSGMADVAALTGDTSYIHAIDRIWENIVQKKLYITGGVGALYGGEAFGQNYELPNMSAYCETCAAIGNVYTNYRLFLLHGESKYYDVLERTLYNALISGMSIDGGNFFYPNPLESEGQFLRQPWFGCACCPSNISRFIPSLPGYVYATKGDNLYVNLFTSNTTELKLHGKKVQLQQETRYPWDGDIILRILQNKAGLFTLKIRIPGWVKGQVVPSDLYTYADKEKLDYTIISVNEKEAEGRVTEDGYFSIQGKWKKGDEIRVHFDMKPRYVRAHEKVEADKGRICIERGPLVYCAEFADNDFDLGGLVLSQTSDIQVTEQPELLHGLSVLSTQAQVLSYDAQHRVQVQDVQLKLIPYYAWNHRGKGRMMVWLPQRIQDTKL